MSQYKTKTFHIPQIPTIYFQILTGYRMNDWGKESVRVLSESIQTPWLFPHFVTLQPYSKMDSIVCFFHQSTHPIMTAKTGFKIFFYSLESSWVWHYKLGTPVFGEFFPFFPADPSSVRLDGERHCTAIFRSLQRCSIGFKSGLLLGHSRPFLCCLGCVLRVVVLLEGEPSPQSEVLSALEQGSQGSLCTLLSSSFPQSWLVSQSLPLKNIPIVWSCHHHASP